MQTFLMSGSKFMLPSYRPSYTLGRQQNVSWRILITSFIIVVMIGLGYILAVSNFFNPEPYYIYYGSRGPFKVQVLNETLPLDALKPDNLKIGEPATRFKPGEWLGFISDLTIEKDVRSESLVELYNIRLDRVIAKSDFIQNVTERRIGEKNFYYFLPKDLPKGPYELRRSAIYIPKNNARVRKVFPVFLFEVE